MAKELVRHGDEVRLVVNIDAPVPIAANLNPNFAYDEVTSAFLMVKTFGRCSGKDIAVRLDQFKRIAFTPRSWPRSTSSSPRRGSCPAGSTPADLEHPYRTVHSNLTALGSTRYCREEGRPRYRSGQLTVVTSTDGVDKGAERPPGTGLVDLHRSTGGRSRAGAG